MSDPYLGEIRMMAFSFAPAGWALCQGQTVAVSQNQALFALLGTTYGGTGVTNFMLPNLSSRTPVGAGTGLGLSAIVPGEVGGVENVTLTISQMPIHTHVASTTPSTASASVAVPASTASTGAQVAPATNTVLGEVTASGRTATLYNTSTPDTTLAPFNASVNIPAVPVSVGTTGQSLPVALRNPYLGMNFCIALQGVYPTRG